MKHLVTPFRTGLMTAVLAVAGTAQTNAQQVVSKLIATPKSEILTPTAQPKSVVKALGDIKPSYKTPVPLAYLGTITTDDNANSNYLFKHKDINDGAWLLVSSDKQTSYLNESSGIVTSYQWNVPGSNPSSFSTADIKASYSVPGTYKMPTLKVGNGTDSKEYTAPYTVKVGGTSEITTMDCREWGSTYTLGAYQYGPGEGYVGGTNAVDIVGWGNLFMLGTDEAFLDGVNVYLHHKPTKFKDDAQIVVKVWMTSITASNATFAYIPVEVGTIKMKDIKADGEDGAWAPIYGGAVINIKFDEPLSMFGKTTFFVSVEGFSNDPATEDFIILEDMVGKKLDLVQNSNLLCHNSFARQKGELDYLRPINMYGGGTGAFAICPVISIPYTPTGINSATANGSKRLVARFCDSNTIEVTAPADGNVTVTEAGGTILAKGKIVDGKAQIAIPGAGHGLYIVSGPHGQSAKILR